MKKYLPVIFVIVGLLVLVGVYFFVVRKSSGLENKGNEPNNEESQPLPEVKIDARPIASITPSSDGHWLTMKIEKIKLQASSMDYELLYQLPDGRTQGVPGTVSLSGVDSIERKLLLGSESSGKFRYDEGVKNGTLSLKFRDSAGKLTAKFLTDFVLLSETKELVSKDGKFKATLNKVMPKTFFVIMDTFGVPGDINLEDGFKHQVYGLFTSSTTKLSGTFTIDGANYVTLWTGASWISKISEKDFGAGIFVATSQ